MVRRLVMGLVLTGWLLPPPAIAATTEELEAQLKGQAKLIEQLQQQVNELKRAQAVREAERPTDMATSAHPDDAGRSAQSDSHFSRPYTDLTAKSPSAVGRYVEKLTGATVGGYITEQLENFESANRTFNNQRFILFVGRELTDRIRFYSEVEFEQLASLEADPADSRGGALEVEQAWFDYGIHEGVNLRFGNVLVPFGQFNLHHDDPLQELVDRPIVDRRVIPTTWTETGAGAWGEWNPWNDARLRYEAYVVNGLNNTISATTGGLRGARGSFGSDNNSDKALVGRVSLTPGPWLDVGVAGYTGDYDTDNHRINGAALDWTTKYGPVELLGEAALFDLQRGLTSSGAVVPDKLWGTYVEGRYHFWPSWLSSTFLGRGFKHPRLTGTLRYDHGAIVRFASAGDFTSDRVTFGLNYRPIEDFVVKLDYEVNNGNLEHGNANGFVAAAALSF
ncbi:MAG: hypothetical protein HYZ89_06370 [Candidatus Omnitrophica bacterium]|nr:hypothetical protein [Candidatus Omnitrophota bacterium]